MSEILEHIHQDHRNMICLLDLLDTELRELTVGNDPDYSLMANIIDYFSHYPTHYHHPLEDSIFEWLSRERPVFANEIEELRRQHESQAQLVARLSTLMQGVVAGHMVPRSEIIDLTAEFIEVQREHIDCEERHLLKETEGIISGLHLAEIPLPDRASLDPLFGEEVDQNYALLAVALGRHQEEDSSSDREAASISSAGSV